jgi:Flp pilus assembly protein TadB
MCGHRHHQHRHHVERRVERDPTLRVSDRERDDVVTLLRDHAADGRLTAEELDERVERALHARTGTELDGLLADLPYRRPERQQRQERRDAFRGLSWLAAIAVLLVSIWLVTGAGYFWPVWIIGFMAFSLFKRGRLRGAHWA